LPCYGALEIVGVIVIIIIIIIIIIICPQSKKNTMQYSESVEDERNKYTN